LQDLYFFLRLILNIIATTDEIINPATNKNIQRLFSLKRRITEVGKELDNGFEFYNGLNTSDKEKYWKEDTKILNLFFVFIKTLCLNLYDHKL